MQTEYASQSDFLRDCIAGLKAKSRANNLADVAREINITDSTLNRIESGHTKEPHFNNAIKIVAGLCKGGDVRAFLKEKYPPLLKAYDEVYGGAEESRFMGDTLEQFYRDSSTYQIVLMLATDAGASRGEIQLNFGLTGISALEKILNTGLVIEKNGRYYIEQEVNLSPETAAALASNLVANNYDPAKMGTKSNANVVMCQSVNGDMVKPWINAEIASLRKRYWEFINKPECKGNDIYWVTLSADMLLKDSVSNSSEKVLQ